ncbi:MAG: SDR family oxidoreductase [Dehalococcoidales bacterium]|nr:MAG: SDR family oxidoreductase [Dehalococcoidales bacterium]
MDLGLKGKVAIVTGTGRKGAMGETIGVGLAREGVNVACVDIVIEGAEEIANGIAESTGVKTIALKVDQSDPQQVKDAVVKINTELGPVDILVNNAAMMGPFGRIEKMELKDWQAMINVNLDGCYYWIREVWNTMTEKNFGRIINISSVAGVMGGFGQVNYSASKAGVIAIAKTAALEGARKGITANAVTLGVVATGQSAETNEASERLKMRIAMRKFGDPEDVANMVAFLASEKAGYVTGQDIHVMGGLDLFTY